VPNLYIIGGCNGAGKTTASQTLLPKILNCKEFVNADAIAAGLSPFQPADVAFKAGRLMLERIEMLADEGVDFAFETTLATRSYVPFLEACRKDGYTVHVILLYLPTVELAIKRVEERTRSGGHDIPREIVRRRFRRGLVNFRDLYLPRSDFFLVYDNSRKAPSIIARGHKGVADEIYNHDIWQSIIDK